MNRSIPSLSAPLLPALAGLLLVATGPGAAAPAAAVQDGPPADRSSASDTTEAELEKVASVEGITEYRLSNGLKVLLFPDPSQANTTVNITYFVGSAAESYGERGMAHLFEHMLFRGTPDHPDIDQELTEHGANANGTTWFDRTNYYETFPAGEENLTWALDLEADRMRNSFLSAEDLEAERTVVRNEFEIGANYPLRRLMTRTQAAAFRWHNYGNSTIGSRSDIMNVPMDQLHAFYDRYYQPDNAVLIIAGKFDRERALRLVREKFGSIPSPDRDGEGSLAPDYTEEPPQRGPREVTVRGVGDNQHLLALYHTPSGSHPDAAAVDLLGHVLANEPSGRLYQALVETGKASDVGAVDYQLEDPGMFRLTVEVRKEDALEEAERTFLAVMDSLRRHPPTDEEVERARADRLRDMRLLFNDSRRLAIQLSDWAATGDWRLFFLHRDRIEDVTTEEVAAAAKRYLVPSNRTLGRFVPTEEEPELARVPAPPDVTELVASYEGREGTAAGEAFEPTHANIEEHTVRDSLASGFEVALLPKASRGGSVTAQFTLRIGSLESLTGTGAASDLTAAMLMRGTEELDRQGIQDRLAELQSEMRIYGGGNTVSGFIQSTRENLPDVLRLLRDVLRNPAFDSAAFETLKDERLAALESQMSQPLPRGFRAFNRTVQPYPEGHPNYTPTLEKQMEAIRETTLREVRSFHRRFYGAQGGTMAVVGDMDPDRVRSVLGETFGSWTPEVPFERIPTPVREPEAASRQISLPDKPNAAFLTGTRLELRDDHPDYPALLIGSELLGGGFLSSRLGERLRNEEGLAYAVGSSFFAHPIDRYGTFLAFATYSPQNREKVMSITREELAQALEEGFTEEEVERAKSGWLEQRRTARSEDRQLAGTLSNHLYVDRTMTWERTLEEEVRALTPEEIRRALAEHLDLDRFVRVTAGDFPAEGEAGAVSGGS